MALKALFYIGDFFAYQNRKRGSLNYPHTAGALLILSTMQKSLLQIGQKNF